MSLNGEILIGGHSHRDYEVITQKSPYTMLKRNPLDKSFEKHFETYFNITEKGRFPFIEAITGKKKDFSQPVLFYRKKSNSK